MDEKTLDKVVVDIAETRKDVEYIKQMIETNIANQMGDHETRLRGLEKFRWTTIGAVSVISSIFTIVISKLVN